MKRRDFLKTAAVSTAALAIDATAPAGKGDSMNAPDKASGFPKREYGKTGEMLSIIGFGGIVVMNAEQDHANRVVAESVERGINYFDVAPSYGNAEEKLGPAIEPFRDRIFLACKTGQRERPGAEAEFARSLERLRTDHFDLYQLHGITNVQNDVDKVFLSGGVMDFLIEKRQEGAIRYLGFSAHSIEAATAAMDRFDFDSVLFPVNFANWHKGEFGHQIMEKAKSKGVARLALKALARQQWPEDDPLRQKYGKCWYQPLTDPREAELGLRFTLSQPITAAIPPGEESLFRLACDLAERFKPLTTQEDSELKELAAGLKPIFSTV